ncbi:hypothetical protein [Methylomonas sp. AM2-LC]|uniref:hypothetical protein n=1 Tax=Methylomonas sp. AM2-LC TaxID=3153301 RepID=UPI003264CA25
MKSSLFSPVTIATLLVAGTFFTLQVSAQPVITQDRDSQARNFYQQVNNCQSVQPCIITFAAIPAGKRLIVEHVSAIVTMPTAGYLNLVELRGTSGSNVFQFLPAVAATGQYGGQFNYIVNQPVLAAYNAGEVPTVDTFATNGDTVSTLATISGYLIDVP